MESQTFDVTILGAGPGGYVAAIRAAQRGKRVAVIEKDRLGGVCLNWGCIPTKALLRIAEEREFLANAAHSGFEIGEVRVQWDTVIRRSREAAEKLAGGVAFLLKKHKIPVLSGHGRFLSPNRISVETKEGSREIVTTHTIIATGGRPSLLPGVVPDGEKILTSKEAMVLEKRPERLAVIGAGAIGLEFAYFYSAFGTEVTLLEYAPRALPGGDPEVSEALARSFRRRGIRVVVSARVASVVRKDEQVTVEYEVDGRSERVTADAVLVATGVRGNIEDMGLERIGVKTSRSFIEVNPDFETNVAGVYAIGDVIGPPALAHSASFEGLHAVHHLAGESPAPFDHRNVPACIYCHPQVASVGLTEPEARDAGYDVGIGRFPFTANGKAIAVGDSEGFVKVIADRRTGEVLGAHIIGAEATELVSELVLARSAELTVHDLHHSIHAHPTLSESVMEAAADWAGEATAI